MDFNKKLLDKIDNLVKLSNNFDSNFKIVFELEPNTKIDEKNAEILYTMTSDYISIRKKHGELLLMMNELMNKKNNFNTTNDEKKTDKKNKKEDMNLKNDDEINFLYDISTFTTLMNNVTDLINNIDYEYKKIALKYPKFINKKQITIILLKSDTVSNDKYTKMIEELKKDYPEHKYIISKCENKTDISKCEEEFKKYNIKIKSIKNLPLIYIVNDDTVTEIPISQIDDIQPIKNLM